MHVKSQYIIFYWLFVFTHGKLLIPHGELEGDISLGVGDDESIPVDLKSTIRLWDKDLQQFFVSIFYTNHSIFIFIFMK